MAEHLSAENAAPGMRVYFWRSFVRNGNHLYRADPVYGTVEKVCASSVFVMFDEGRRRRYGLADLHCLRIARAAGGAPPRSALHVKRKDTPCRTSTLRTP